MATARTINGRALAEAWRADIAAQVAALEAPLGLAAVCAEGDDALRSFVRLKQKAAQEAGIAFSSYFVVDEAAMRSTLAYLADDDAVHGIFVELPLPAGWDRDALCSLIPSGKDVDVLSSAARRDALVLPPAVLALRRVLDSEGIVPAGLRAAVVGQGELVGQPVARWLRDQGATVDVIDIGTPHPADAASRADVLVCGAGVPGLVTGDWVKPGATVVDYGWGEGKGDVDAESVRKKAGALTPVPGGMGPLVIAAVLENLLTLATR